MAILVGSQRFAFIGGGKMGEAIVGGWIASEVAPASDLKSENFLMVEPAVDRRSYLSDRYKVTCVADVDDVSAVDTVILAVKPQKMLEVLEKVRGLPAFEKALFVSIAAGMTTETLTEALPKSSRLVRVMPNLPLLVGEGATVVCASSTSAADDVERVRDLFACLGKAEVINEELVDAVSALSGSGPAYVAAMIESLVKAGMKQGIPFALAESFAMQTVYGTALQLKETGQSPSSLREAVSSPGGTTLAALAAMDAAGMDSVYEQGVAAAVHRAKELGSCKI